MMTWIKTIEEADAHGELQTIYEAQKSAAGQLANILKVHSLAPHVLSAHLALYQAVMHSPGELGRPQREMIAVSVSAANHCEY